MPLILNINNEKSNMEKEIRISPFELAGAEIPEKRKESEKVFNNDTVPEEDRALSEDEVKDEIMSMSLETLINVFEAATEKCIEDRNFIDAVFNATKASELVEIGMFLVNAHINAQKENGDEIRKGAANG